MDITLEKKKVGSFNIFTLKEGGDLPVPVKVLILENLNKSFQNCKKNS